MAAIRCKANTKNGEPCGAYALADSDYCYMHDTARGADRAAARKLGGLHRRVNHGWGDISALPKQIRTLTDVLALLDYVLAEAIPLENSIARTRALIALAAEFTNAIRGGDIEARLQALEELGNVRNR